MADSDAGAPAHQNVNSLAESTMADFIAKGTEILDTFKTSIRQFDAKSAQIQDLATAIVQIKTNLKRNTDKNQDDEPVAKQQKRQEVVDLQGNGNLDSESWTKMKL